MPYHSIARFNVFGSDVFHGARVQLDFQMSIDCLDDTFEFTYTVSYISFDSHMIFEPKFSTITTAFTPIDRIHVDGTLQKINDHALVVSTQAKNLKTFHQVVSAGLFNLIQILRSIEQSTKLDYSKFSTNKLYFQEIAPNVFIKPTRQQLLLTTPCSFLYSSLLLQFGVEVQSTEFSASQVGVTIGEIIKRVLRQTQLFYNHHLTLHSVADYRDKYCSLQVDKCFIENCKIANPRFLGITEDDYEARLLDCIVY